MEEFALAYRGVVGGSTRWVFVVVKKERSVVAPSENLRFGVWRPSLALNQNGAA